MLVNARDVCAHKTHSRSARLQDKNKARERKKNCHSEMSNSAASYRDGDGSQEEEHRVAGWSHTGRAEMGREAGAHACHVFLLLLLDILEPGPFIYHHHVGLLPETRRGGAFLGERVQGDQ